MTWPGSEFSTHAPHDSSLLAELHRRAREIFDCALRESSIPAAFDRHLRFEDGGLSFISSAGGRRLSVEAEGLRAPGADSFSEIRIVALGKAALPMVETLLERLPRGIPVRGVCCAPSLPQNPQRGIDYYAGGHPFPNRDSLRSARAALELLKSARGSTLVFFLVSGGGSSLFEAPLDRETPLEDTVAFYQTLVGCGATIAEINTVRKHFSAVKGGRLAAAAGGAFRVSLFVSDVPARHLDALASGPTLPDCSTAEECREIIERYRILDRFPARVRAFFANSDLPETPRHLPGAERSCTVVLLSNCDLVEAARAHAERLGWTVEIDNGCDDWDYRDAAHYLLERFHRLRRTHSRLCLLSGGEVTVRLEGAPGAGGRNQQFALACALELAGRPVNAPGGPSRTVAASPGEATTILSAGSDGVDGLSPAAGAVADPTTVARARARGFDADAALRGFNAYPLFSALGDTVMSGPTGNNLRDLRIFLSSGKEGS